jgi:chromosome segregation ATPase
LYPRLLRFRTEPEFKNLNEVLEDPLAAEESKGEIHRLQQQIAQLNIQKRQQEADKNKSIAQLEGEKASLLAQLEQLQTTHNTLDLQYQSMHLNVQAKDVIISDKAQTITRLEGEKSSLSTQLTSLQQQHGIMCHKIRTNNMVISEKTQTITKLEGEKGSLLIQLQTAKKEKGEAEQKMRHAQDNHTSLRRVFVTADGCKNELVGKVTA